MRRLLLFAKRPRLGKVKTRLCPPLRPEQALTLYRGFLTDQLDLLRRCAADYRVEVWWDGPPDERSLRGFDLARIAQREQSEGDLGQRLAHAFSGAEVPTVAIGADSPTLGRAAIDHAFAALSVLRPVVLMPSIDGGYVLLGLWRLHPAVFRDIPWSGSSVAEVTLERAKTHGLLVTVLPHGYDVDDAAGLRRLEAELSHPEIAARAPATFRAMRLLF